MTALDKTITVHIDMATALPVSYYSKKNANDFAAKFSGKKHHVCVYVGSQEVMVDVNYDFVKVIPEGVTASFALKHEDDIYHAYNQLHVDAPFHKEDFAKLRVLHIAIGEGTTEFPVTQDVHTSNRTSSAARTTATAMPSTP